MYSGCSENFEKAMETMSRTFCAKIKVGNSEITSGIKSIKWSGGGNAGDSLTIGSTVSATVDVEMKAPDFLLENREIEVYIGLILDDTPEYIPMGKFVVEKPEKSAGNISYTAHDRMISSCEKAYFSDLAYPSNTLSMLGEISSKTGIPVDVSGLSAITVSEKPEGYTCREMIGYIAGLYGCFACIDRNGRLVFRWYAEAGTVDFDRADEPEVAEYDFAVQTLTCAIDKETSYSAGSGTTGIQLSNPLMTQADVTRVFGILEGFSYRPGTVSLRLGDIRVDPWDMMKVTRDGETYFVPCMELMHEYDGGVTTTITAAGKSETEAEYDYKGPTTQAIDRVYTELLLVRDMIADSITVDYLEAHYAKIENLQAVQAQIGKLQADTGEFQQATIDRLTAIEAQIGDLEVEDLEAMWASIHSLEADNAAINNLLAGNLTAENIQAGAITAGSGIIADGAIGDAQISSLSANKLRAGTIDTALVTIASRDSVLSITGSQIMVNDTTDALSPINRVTLGKYRVDADTWEYGLLVRSADGQTVMIDGEGVHNAGITDGAIDNNKVADDANIDGKKLDIQSVVTEINGGETKISSTIVQVGEKSLEVYLGEQESTVSDMKEEVEGIASKKMYRVETYVEGRTQLTDREQTATLVCRVYSWDEEITATLDASCFNWHRLSGDTAGDAEWDEYRGKGKKTVIITTEDVQNNASFYCNVAMEEE